MSDGPGAREANDDVKGTNDAGTESADVDEPEDFDDSEDLEDADDLDEPGDLEEGELDEVMDDDDGHGDGDEDSPEDDLDDEDHHGKSAVPASASKARPAEVADSGESDEDDLLADEVEASLDVILAERLRGDDSDDDDFEADDEEDEGLPNQLATVIPVRQPHEFLCQSCFLLKPPGQLADRDHQLCRDCA